MNESPSLYSNNKQQRKKHKCPLIILPSHLISLNTNTTRYSTNNKDKWNITSVEKADECILSKIKNCTSNVSRIEKLNYSNPVHRKTHIINSKENTSRHFRILSKPLHAIMKNKEDGISKESAHKIQLYSLYQSPVQKIQCASLGFYSNMTLSCSHSPQNLKAKLLRPIKPINSYEIERIKQVILSKQSHSSLPQFNKSYLFFYKIGPVIGRGAFGKINLCLHILSNQLVAIKSFNKKHKKFSYDKIMEEVHLMKIFAEYSNSNNPIVEFYELLETETHLCIVMEYVNGNDLLSLVRKKKLNESKIKYIFNKIVECVKAIHSKRIAHRDIKLENILIGEENKVKICDLGIAKIIARQGEVFKDRCGTLNYIAPEIIKGKGYNAEYADIWSCGVVLFAMLFGKLPYKFDKETKKIDYTIHHDYSKITIQAKDLIQKLLVIDRPKKRLSLNDVLNHNWLSNVTNISLFSHRENEFLRTRWSLDEINFKEENMKTIDVELKEKNKKTKSIIFAPFNSALDEDSNINNNINKDESLMIIKENEIIMYDPNVKEDNMNYMINNNKEADNGVYVNEYENSFIEANKTQTEAQTIDASAFFSTSKLVMNNVFEIMEEYGYKREYVLSFLQKKEFNHATTTYALIVKRLVANKKT